MPSAEIRRRPARLLVLAGTIVTLAGLALVILAAGYVHRNLYPRQIKDSGMSHPMPEASRGDRGTPSNNLEPLTKRFTALGKPVSATWQGGTIDDGWVPGPPIHWFEGVVRLERGRAAQLAADHHAVPVPAPVIDPDLTPALTDGPWVTSTDLSVALSGDGFGGKTFLDVDDDTVVLLFLK